MAIVFTCSACQATMRVVNDALAGRTIRCPKCREAVTLPAPIMANAVADASALAASPPPLPAAAPKDQKQHAGPPPIAARSATSPAPRKGADKPQQQKAPSAFRFGVLDFIGLGVAVLYLGAVVLCLAGVLDPPLPQLSGGGNKMPPPGGNGIIPPPGGGGPTGKLPPKDAAKETQLAAEREQNVLQHAANEKEIMQAVEKLAVAANYTGWSLGPPYGQPNGAVAFDYALNGEFLATATYDKVVHVYEIRTGKAKWQFKGHQDQIKSVAFSPDGKMLASGSQDGKIRLWNLTTGALHKELALNGRVAKLSFYPDDGKLAAVGMPDKGLSKPFVELYNPDTFASQSQSLSSSLRVETAVFSPNGKYLAVADYLDKVQVWELATGKLVETIDCGKQFVQAVAYSPDGWTLAIATGQFGIPASVKLVELESSQERPLGTSHPTQVQRIAFSPDGKLVAIAYDHSSNVAVKIWEVASGQEKGRIPVDSSSSHLKFSPGGTILATSSDYPGGIALWSVAAQQDDKRLVVMDEVKKLRTFATVTRAGDALKVNPFGSMKQQDIEQLKQVKVPMHLQQSYSATPAFLASMAGAKNVVSLDLQGSNKLNDAALVGLKEFENLKELNLESIKGVTDAGLVHLQGLKKLTALKLGQTGVKGVGLVHLKDLPELTALDLDNCKVTDADLAHLAGLTKLRQLRLTFSDMTDAGLAHLQKMTALQKLAIYGNNKIRDAGVVHLKGMTELEDLDVSNTQIGDAGLAHIAGLTKLKRLKLDNTPVSDRGFAHLEKLTNLTALEIGSCYGLQGPGLKHLKELTKVTKLDLRYANINDAGFQHIKELKQLRDLALPINLSDAAIADLVGLANLEALNAQDMQNLKGDGLKHLKANTKLRFLDLRNTKVNDAGLAHLAEATQLEELYLPNEVGNTGLAHLGKLSKLKKLSLAHTKVNDSGVAQLKSLTGLEELDLFDAKITDAALVHIQAMPSLKRVTFTFDKISQDAKNKLKKARPELQGF